MALDPAAYEGHWQLGRLRLLQGRIEEGVEGLARALEFNGQLDSARELMLETFLGRGSEALEGGNMRRPRRILPAHWRLIRTDMSRSTSPQLRPYGSETMRALTRCCAMPLDSILMPWNSGGTCARFIERWAATRRTCRRPIASRQGGTAGGPGWSFSRDGKRIGRR